jgi:hypothetical protein
MLKPFFPFFNFFIFKKLPASPVLVGLVRTGISANDEFGLFREAITDVYISHNARDKYGGKTDSYSGTSRFNGAGPRRTLPEIS